MAYEIIGKGMAHPSGGAHHPSGGVRVVHGGFHGFRGKGWGGGWGPGYVVTGCDLTALRAAYAAWKAAFTSGAPQATLDALRVQFEALLF